MRIAKSINDIIALFSDFSVCPVLDGNKVYIVMNPSKDWEPDQNQLNQIAVRSRPVIPSDPEDVQFANTSRNAILELVNNPQFMRCTTVADQITNFYGHDGGSFPPPFMRGKDRKTSQTWRMTGITKKANEPLTIHFESPDAAEKFIKAVSNGSRYYKIENQLVSVA